MNKSTIVKGIIIILLICCIALLVYIMFIFNGLLNEEKIPNTEDDTNVEKQFSENSTINNNNQDTLEDVLEKNEIELLSIKNNVIRVNFPKELYNNDGTSNETYFNNLIDSVKTFYSKKSFILLDPIKNIQIDVIYSSDNEAYKIKINNIEDYYENVDGDTYIEVENTKIERSSNIITTNNILFKLSNNSSYFSSIEELLEEDQELENGYISYNKGQIKLRKSKINTVRNIIFTSDYEGEINKDINMKTSLKEILEKYPDNAFGSLDKGYLGYITGDYYFFFYDDEISVYSYSYSENEQFEKLLGNYLESKDLDKFVSSIQKNYKTYDYLEYDSEIKKAYILFSNRGIEIDIEENNPKGITLYNNYHFSNNTKTYVKEGKIKLNSYEDLVNKTEMERRK